MKNCSNHHQRAISLRGFISLRGLSWNIGENFLCIFMVVAFLVAVNGCAGLDKAEETATDMAETWGIEVTRLHLTANGYMIDFRYRVLDADKAKELFSRKNKPLLIDQASGKVLAVPNMGKIGPLRTSNKPKEGKIYWMFFNNISGLIHSGSRVSVVIGKFRVENLVVH